MFQCWTVLKLEDEDVFVESNELDAVVARKF